MMKMKKLACVLLTALLAASLFTACGGAGGSSAASPAASPAGESAAPAGEEAPGGETAKELDFYSAILKEEGSIALAEMFTAESGVKANVHYYESADFVQAFMVAVNGGSPVDVMLLNGQDVRNFMQNGLLQDLSASPNLDRISDAAVNQYTYNDRVWALGAKGGNSSGLYLNMDVFEQYGREAPATVQDIYDFNAELVADGLSFFAFGGGNKYMWPMWYFSIFGQTSGDQPVERTEAILRGEAKFTDQDTIDAMNVIQEMTAQNVWQQGFNGVDSDGGKAVFINGQAAAFYGGTWETTTFLEAGMQNLLLVPFPMVTDKAGVTSIQTGNASDGAWGVYSKVDPARQGAVDAFLEFVTRDSTIQACRDSDLFDLRDYARVSCNKNMGLAPDADPLTVKQLEMLETMTFTHPDWIYPGEITTQLQDALQGLTSGQIDAPAAAQLMQDKMDEMLAAGYDYDAVTPLA